MVVFGLNLEGLAWRYQSWGRLSLEMAPGRVNLLGSGVERRGRLESVLGTWPRLTVEGQCKALFERVWSQD